MKIFSDVLCRLRLLLEHMKLVRRNGHPIAGSVYIQYGGWCPVPPFNKEEVSCYRIFIFCCFCVLLYISFFCLMYFVTSLLIVFYIIKYLNISTFVEFIFFFTLKYAKTKPILFYLFQFQKYMSFGEIDEDENDDEEEEEKEYIDEDETEAEENEEEEAEEEEAEEEENDEMEPLEDG